MKKVTVIIEYADKNLSAYIENAPIITVGKNLQEIEDNIKSAIDLYLEDNNSPCELLKGEYELSSNISVSVHYWSANHSCLPVRGRGYGRRNQVGDLLEDHIPVAYPQYIALLDLYDH